jgi:hypothetical protein
MSILPLWWGAHFLLCSTYAVQDAPQNVAVPLPLQMSCKGALHDTCTD